jgi:hypothetical protein
VSVHQRTQARDAALDKNLRELLEVLAPRAAGSAPRWRLTCNGPRTGLKIFVQTSKGKAMGTHKWTRQFQLEVMEPRWTPGGGSGGVLDRLSCRIREEIPQAPLAHVLPLATCGSNSIRAGPGGYAFHRVTVSSLQKVREA